MSWWIATRSVAVEDFTVIIITGGATMAGDGVGGIMAGGVITAGGGITVITPSGDALFCNQLSAR